MKKRGLLFVVSGLSGAGKGTLCNLMLERFEDLHLSISTTTRKPREGELHGKNYVFTDKEDFEEKIRRGEFLEWARVYNNYYGTPASFVLSNLNQGKDIILEIDTQGAMQIKERYPEGIFIFILPPNLKEQEKRIVLRGGEDEDSVKLRLESAKDEIRAALNYDYIIVNRELDVAAKKLESIIIAERCRTSRHHHLFHEEEIKDHDVSFDRFSVKKYDSKYTIAVAAAKRARQLLDMSKEKKEAGESAEPLGKPVSRALFELDTKKIIIERPKPSNK